MTHASTAPVSPLRRLCVRMLGGVAGIAARLAGGSAASALTLDRRWLRAAEREIGHGAGRVDLVGAGPGDPELLTLKARRLLAEAEVVVHDRLISDDILALIPRRAHRIAAGKQGFGPSVPQEEINALLVQHARAGARVVRLKSGDPGVYGRLDEEIAALAANGIDWTIVPGLTAASAAAASLGQGLTARGRNTGVRLLTGHDVAGFADQDWRGLAEPGAVAAIYMGKRAARFLQGRLLMHGAGGDTPVSVVENASRPDQRIVATTLGTLPAALDGVDGPAVLLYGLAPRDAAARAEREEKSA